MPTKRKVWKFIEPDDFHLARRKAGLSKEMAADMLNVDVRTIRNWETGKSKIPYPAFRLVRMAAGYGLVANQWNDWGFYKGKLYSPDGRSFAPEELYYMSHYISIARTCIKERQQLKNILLTNASERGADSAPLPNAPINVTMTSEKASNATALSGARPFRDAVVIAVDFSQQRKNSEELQHSLQKDAFGEYPTAANEACYG